MRQAQERGVGKPLEVPQLRRPAFLNNFKYLWWKLSSSYSIYPSLGSIIVSILSACASLGYKCLSLSRTLTELAERYKQSRLSILSIAQECITTRLAWSLIERWAAENSGSFADYDDVHETIQSTLHAGVLIMSALESDLMSLQKPSNSQSFLWGTKIVWNEHVFRQHLDRMRGLVTSLTLLLDTLKLPTSCDGVPLLLPKQIVFQDVSQSVRASMDERESLDLRYIPFSFENELPRRFSTLLTYTVCKEEDVGVPIQISEHRIPEAAAKMRRESKLSQDHGCRGYVGQRISYITKDRKDCYSSRAAQPENW
ncbi:uncharacterized protein BDR25DRAFT_358095 [Lindgomyces ingoldianus]|uniref:Uncharacterized protein n=1 Tax=Lindgomyces ingoldianus TaxID=673940 RepID=A0ACB6QNY1_9PLEO|nr:uncharacterized protein BDR25DRAFT_358095 [Lindgomyces ingoldianus]KAF2467825.1 hypothetical protein BDR25DRAFT_358095 [Lindgomyces ingoldianus]